MVFLLPRNIGKITFLSVLLALVSSKNMGIAAASALGDESSTSTGESFSSDIVDQVDLHHGRSIVRNLVGGSYDFTSHGTTPLTDGKPGTTTFFGRDTFLSGDGKVLIVGAPRDNTSTGQLYVYDWDDDSQDWSLTEAVPGPFGEGSKFGHTIASSFDGTTIAVSAPEHNSGVGLVTVYTRSGSNGGLLSPKGDSFSGCPTSTTACWFGHLLELSLDGSSLGIVSGGENCNAVYDYSNGTWSRRGNLLCQSGSAGAMVFSGDGNVIGSGSWQDNRFHTWKWDSDTTSWKDYGGGLIESPPNLANVNGAQFGWAASMSYDATVIAVASYTQKELHIYKFQNGIWTRPSNWPIIYTAGRPWEVDISGNGQVIAVGCQGLGDDTVEIRRLDDAGTWDKIFNVPNVAATENLELSGDGSIVAFRNVPTSYVYTMSNADLRQSDYDPTTSSAGGDPHFVAFGGMHYSWHGACDAVLSRSADLNIEVHIRTKRAQFRDTAYSYIAAVAAKIHSDIIEVSENGSLFVNGSEVFDASAKATMSLSDCCALTKTTQGSKHRIVVYNIDLSNGRSIQVRANTKLGMIFVDMKGSFPNAEGLLGSSNSEALLDRDGLPTFRRNINSFGDHWQIQGHEEKLFLDKDHHPQFPHGCSYDLSLPAQEDQAAVPNKKKKDRALRRRLMEDTSTSDNTVSFEDASMSCANSKGQKKEFCIMDVMTMNDLDLSKDPFYLSS